MHDHVHFMAASDHATKTRASRTLEECSDLWTGGGGGLSAGAIAGIVIGCIVGVLLLMALLAFLLKRRNKMCAADHCSRNVVCSSVDYTWCIS